MFEFYKAIENTDTHSLEIKKYQCEEDSEGIALKERLKEELSKYERFSVTYIDRYYHCNRVEETYPIDLSVSVFKENKFIGCLVNGTLFALKREYFTEYEEIFGATSFKIADNYRKKHATD